MSPSPPRYMALRPGISSATRLYYNGNQESSTVPVTASDFEQSFSRKSSFDSGSSTLDHNIQPHYIQQRRTTNEENMTTYYLYGKDGRITATHLNPKAQVFIRSPESTCANGQHKDVVGAYLAHRKMNYPAPTGHEAHLRQDLPQQESQRFKSIGVSESMERSHWSSDEQESSANPDSSHAGSTSTLGYVGWASHSGIARSYPDPEDIRHMHTLHSLLSYVQPERKLNSLDGPKIEIVEQDTGVVFGYQVSKKLLILFLGRRVVSKYIRTVSRENDKSWGVPIYQQLCLPRGKSSKAAIRVLIVWMMRACQYNTMGTMKQISIPKKTFVACSLAQTMELFDLHKDALRLDHCIAQTHFVRPIFAAELETLWNCLGEGSRYVYAAIKIVGNRIQEHERHESKAVPGIDKDMYALMKEYPRLEARLRDLYLNEQYSPSFSTQWTKKLGESQLHVTQCQSADADNSQAANGIEAAKHSLGASYAISDKPKLSAVGVDTNSDVSRAESGSMLKGGSTKIEG